MAIRDFSRLIPAVLYLRRSTDRQEASIKDQRTAVAKYAADKGYQIIREYVDDGISGDATNKRKAFQQMIADAERGEFRAILCWDQDRFGRFDSIEAGRWIYPLRQAGVKLATVSQGVVDWSDFAGRMIYGIQQEAKHAFLLDLSRNVTRGIAGCINDGFRAGRAPFGFALEAVIVPGRLRPRKKLVLGDVAKQKIVQRIFNEFVRDGRSIHSIKDRLNAEGIAAPSGIAWRFETVKGILTNAAYVGDYVAAGRTSGKYYTVSGGEVVRAEGRYQEKQPIIRRDAHPAIIDRVTFAKAQELIPRISRTRRKRTPENNPYLLNGKLLCGHCGAELWGDNHRSLTYKCHGEKNGGCPGNRVNERDVLSAIAAHIHSEFLALDGKALAWKAHRGKLELDDLPKAFAKIKALVAPPNQPASDRKRLDQEQRKLQADIAKARSNLVLLDAENIPAAQDRIRGLFDDLSSIDAELSRQPTTESDINAEAAEVLRSLYWLGIAFSSIAQGPWTDESEGVEFPRDHAPVRRWLQALQGITVHTERTGKGNASRYRFLGGEIHFELPPQKYTQQDSNLQPSVP